MSVLDMVKNGDKYDTAINIIGGLRDCEMIFNAIDIYFNRSESLKELVTHGDELTLRTEKSRVRIERAIRKAFLRFSSPAHQGLMQSIFSRSVPLKDKVLILTWQFALNNRLFREITANVFSKIYFSGRTTISKEDIIAYVKEILAQEDNGCAGKMRWSESTINTLATKYLNLMKKLDLLSGDKVKSFEPIRPSSEAQVLFLYFADLYDSDRKNLFKNAFLPLSFIPLEDLHGRLKKLSLKGSFHMSYDGIALNVDLIHSHKEICDALYA